MSMPFMVRVSDDMGTEVHAVVEAWNISPAEFFRIAADDLLRRPLGEQQAVIDRWSARQAMRGVGTEGPSRNRSFDNILKTGKRLLVDAGNRNDEELKREIKEWLTTQMTEMINALIIQEEVKNNDKS